MRYPNITRAVFLERPNRFIAEVEIAGRETGLFPEPDKGAVVGQRETVHVKNTGRCRELLVPGCEVWLVRSDDPKRKTRYDLVAVRKSTGVLFNIDSQAPNKVVREWLDARDHDRVIPEYTYGESRIDFYMERILPKDGRLQGSQNHAVERHLMEVKGCTLEFDNIGYFPDAPTERGVKHIRELIRAVEEGFRATLAFVIQMDGVTEVRPYAEADPAFAQAMKDAEDAGVEILFLPCHVEPDSLVITAP